MAEQMMIAFESDHDAYCELGEVIWPLIRPYIKERVEEMLRWGEFADMTEDWMQRCEQIARESVREEILDGR
jgi:hypothetical protein